MGRDLAAKAEKEVGVATTLASGKEAEVAQLRAQMKSQAEKFAQASKDWASVKAGLETGVEQAQEAAGMANAKLAEYMKRREEDTTGAVAAGSVKAAMAKAEKAEAAKAAAKDVMALLQQDKLEQSAKAAEGRFAED